MIGTRSFDRTNRACDTPRFITSVRELKVTSHRAQNDTNRRTTRLDGYAVSQRKRKRVEEAFGFQDPCSGGRAFGDWIGSVGCLHSQRPHTIWSGRAILGPEPHRQKCLRWLKTRSYLPAQRPIARPLRLRNRPEKSRVTARLCSQSLFSLLDRKSRLQQDPENGANHHRKPSHFVR
jgi:hypothetical protein